MSSARPQKGLWAPRRGCPGLTTQGAVGSLRNPHSAPRSDLVSDLGLTRLSYHLMDRRISLTAVHSATSIPLPTLSMYANGHRNISARHRPLIASVLQIPAGLLVGYCTSSELVILGEAMTTTPTPEPDYEPAHPEFIPDPDFDDDDSPADNDPE